MNNSIINPITTERLTLVSLSTAFLAFMIEGDFVSAGEEGGFTIPSGCSLLKKKWVERRLKMIKDDRDQHRWMYRAMVRKSDNLMVGHISFHHKAPDPDLLDISPLAAELGYTVEFVYRGQGYAQESARAMIEWAHGTENIQTFVLSISPDNLPSLKIARSLGFVKIAERVDDEDGLEFVFRADLT